MKKEIAKADNEILKFWFDEISPARWFDADPAFDELIRRRFSEVHGAAVRGELFEWRETLSGRLAEIIVLDQFSRNLFRHHPAAYASDGMALILAQELVKQPDFNLLPVEKRDVALLPYMHAESSAIHEIAIKLYKKFGSEDSLKFEIAHKRTIDKFGRYPHRNKALNRRSTEEEMTWLEK
ncbi:DUF924 family protein [Brenneria rubrifaciens]|uniref:DUF924 domain-containing protein n=1 Tax=Brenneria rubrifaciens TaxID=55213 RepID=A0A4P8QNA1_9GAMM|nr:DUF924 family protein [Brenneria rubrifaciens]QCR07806.1 DUF924 domain-containing protein [Brenneria rubrifaciens]